MDATLTLIGSGGDGGFFGSGAGRDTGSQGLWSGEVGTGDCRDEGVGLGVVSDGGGCLVDFLGPSLGLLTTG